MANEITAPITVTVQTITAPVTVTAAKEIVAPLIIGTYASIDWLNLPISADGLNAGDPYTQTAAELGGTGTTKVVCIV